MSEAIKPTPGDVVILTPQDLAALASTGLSPRQLVERVKELEEALDKLAKSYERVMQMGAPPPDALKAARAALSKSLPNTVAEVK